MQEDGCASCTDIECGACFEQLIYKAPAADVAPVVHGEWEYLEQFWDDTIYRCTACGEEFAPFEDVPKIQNMNYCPNCGAKMDGGK